MMGGWTLQQIRCPHGPPNHGDEEKGLLACPGSIAKLILHSHSSSSPAPDSPAGSSNHLKSQDSHVCALVFTTWIMEFFQLPPLFAQEHRLCLEAS
ncbi:hypothetical protein llap_21097 [Limosa lapponica baueri]|uniref:Uncharacterized protein n=1 Tax=Limosa lapponica baueri TaxID=1758121 RepID=A0A2I0T482_LIMLA|nr:hypothetical protein llap_21097 [Limosa lapponica baueri]